MIDLASPNITLHTRKRHEVENAQYHALSPAENFGHHFFEEKYGGRHDFRFRSGPTGMYNCHGLVFASRRTCIHHATEVRKIIEDDGYDVIPKEKVKPGDIVLYFTEAGDDIWHSAVVIEEPKPGNQFVPIVLSKIGKWKEAVHPANAFPEYYPFAYAKYYRIRD